MCPGHTSSHIRVHTLHPLKTCSCLCTFLLVARRQTTVLFHPQEPVGKGVAGLSPGSQSLKLPFPTVDPGCLWWSPPRQEKTHSSRSRAPAWCRFDRGPFHLMEVSQCLLIPSEGSAEVGRHWDSTAYNVEISLTTPAFPSRLPGSATSYLRRAIQPL